MENQRAFTRVFLEITKYTERLAMLSEDILQIYASSFRENWESPALTEYTTDETLTYADLARRIARTHIFFELSGVRPGDKVGLLGKNSVSWVVSYMAILTYGAVVVPILPDFNPQDAQHILNHSDSVMLFVSDHIWEHLDFDHLPAIKIATLGCWRRYPAAAPRWNRCSAGPGCRSCRIP